MEGFPSADVLPSTRHSRARGNPGLFSAELAWIPAFAGMTEPRVNSAYFGFFILWIIHAAVFQERTKVTKVSDISD